MVSKYPLIALTTEGVSQSGIDSLHRSGIILAPLETLSPRTDQTPELAPENARYKDVWTKLRVFGFDSYERIVLIDSDMLFLREMDELFQMPMPGSDWIAAVPACTCDPTEMEGYPEDW